MTSVSVVVITYNRAHKILNILKSLESQTFKNFELVLIIDGSTDNTRLVVEEAKLNFESFKIVEQPNSGRSVARNNGAAHASGELIIFFDDDMRPFPDCIEQHVKHHNSFPDTICIGTQEEDPELFTTDFQKFRISLTDKWAKDMPKYGEPLSEKATFFTTANCSIPKIKLQELGGFDKRVIDVEDFDLGARAFKKGLRIYVNNNARAYHDEIISCASFIKRQRDYAIAYENLVKIKPEFKDDYLTTKEYRPGILKKLIFGIFAQKSLVQTIDQKNYLPYFLPKSIRYKMYDVITAGLAKVYKNRPIS